jgi:plastocyanin
MTSTLSSSFNYSSPRTTILVLSLFLLLINIINNVNAAEVVINVAGKGLAFSPQNVTVAKGDTIKFQLFKSIHLIDESDAPGQCVKSTKVTKPLSLIANVPDTTLTYEITKDSGSIYYFDSYAQHCLNGMWGIITIGDPSKAVPDNPTSTSASKTETSSPPSETSAADNTGFINKNNLLLPIIIACVVAAAIALVIFCCFIRRRRSSAKKY